MFLRHAQIACLLATWLTACTSFKPALTPELKSTINTLKVVSFVPQEELSAQTNASIAGTVVGTQFGLLGVLFGSSIDASVNSDRATEADARVEPYRAVLSDYDARETLQAGLQEATQNIEWLNVTEFVTSIPAVNFKVEDYLDSIEEDAVMVLNSRYALTPELESLEVFTQVAIYTKSTLAKFNATVRANKRRRLKPVYESGLMYQSKFYSARYSILDEEALAAKITAVEMEYAEKIARRRQKTRLFEAYRDEEIKQLQSKRFTKDRDGKAPKWLDNHGQLLIATLSEGFLTQAKLLQLDLQDPLTESEYKNAAVKVHVLKLAGGSSSNLQSAVQKGWQIAENGTRKAIRLEDGIIYSIDKAEFIRPVNGIRR